jgi:hypothetical protein
MKRISLILVSFLTILSITSCGFIEGLLGGMNGNGLKSSTYTLSIDYEYQGSEIVEIDSPIIFWVMPLDDNGEVQEDPYDPDGPPLRKELYAYTSYGTLSAEIEKGDYAVLAFVDDNGDGNLNLGDFYVVYDRRSIADIFLDRIELYGNRFVYVGFNDYYSWHAVFIREPQESQIVYDSFWAHGGFLGAEVSEVLVHVEGGPEYPASIDHDKGYWQFFVDKKLLNTGNNKLTVVAKDTSGNTIDSYSVQFYY